MELPVLRSRKQALLEREPMHGIWSVCVRAAVVVMVLLATSSMADDEKANTVPIVEQWSGTYSAQDAASRVVVRDTEGWKQLWRAMHGRRSPMPEVPQIDFRKHMAIGVFMGTKPSGGYSVRITGIVRNEKTMVSVREQSPGPGEMVTMALTAPYHVVVVPRSEEPIEFVYASTHEEIPLTAVTKRHLSSDFVYRGTNVTIDIRPAEIFVQKNGGPNTIEFLLDYPLVGDLAAEMVVEFATSDELGVGFRGGTPVPYYGLRSGDGTKEVYFLLGTYHPKGKHYHILLRREKGAVSAIIDDNPSQGVGRDLTDPAYLGFVMNDVSRVRLHYIRIESPSGKVLMEHGRRDTNKTETAQPAPGHVGRKAAEDGALPSPIRCDVR